MLEIIFFFFSNDVRNKKNIKGESIECCRPVRWNNIKIDTLSLLSRKVPIEYCNS